MGKEGNISPVAQPGLKSGNGVTNDPVPWIGPIAFVAAAATSASARPVPGAPFTRTNPSAISRSSAAASSRPDANFLIFSATSSDAICEALPTIRVVRLPCEPASNPATSVSGIVT